MRLKGIAHPSLPATHTTLCLRMRCRRVFNDVIVFSSQAWCRVEHTSRDAVPLSSLLLFSLLQHTNVVCLRCCLALDRFIDSGLKVTQYRSTVTPFDRYSRSIVVTGSTL